MSVAEVMQLSGAKGGGEWYVYSEKYSYVWGPFDHIPVIPNKLRDARLLGPCEPRRKTVSRRYVPPTTENPQALHDRIDGYFHDLAQPRKKLTPWENQFIESLQDQFTNRGTLSSKQLEVLKRLHEEKV